MKYDRPKFSVLMANYNNGKYIAESIESVLLQSFTDWELVIVDDCSSDNSMRVISEYLKDSRVKLVVNDKNLGKIETLKKLIHESTSEILGILDSDDVLLKNAIEEICKAYTKHPECGFIYSQFEFCDEFLNSTKVGNSRLMSKSNTNLRKIYTVAFRTFKKNTYYKTEGYDEEIIFAEDRDIIFKFEEVTKFHFVDKILYKYRILENSQSHEAKNNIISGISHIKAKYKAYKRRLGTSIPNLTKRQMSSQLLNAVPLCMKLKEFNRAKYYFSESVEIFPFNILGYSWIIFRFIKYPIYFVYRKIVRANKDFN